MCFWESKTGGEVILWESCNAIPSGACRSYIHALIMLTGSIKQLLMLLIFSSETDIETTAYEHTKTKVEKWYIWWYIKDIEVKTWWLITKNAQMNALSVRITPHVKIFYVKLTNWISRLLCDYEFPMRGWHLTDDVLQHKRACNVTSVDWKKI